MRWSLTNGHSLIGTRPVYYTLSLALTDALQASEHNRGEPVTVWMHFLVPGTLVEEVSSVAEIRATEPPAGWEE